MPNEPLKRHEALKNLSREHHDGLIFALRLQKGVAKRARLEEMENYAIWFWKQHLLPHFKMEELQLFPMLKEDYELVKTARQQHRDLESLFNTQPKTYKDFKAIYELLQLHIRLEERELFNWIQEELNSEELAKFQAIHDSQSTCEVWPHPFWK
ncbi:hemerythrin domain-containing protein [Psychroflexus tropicus]|uniref:hemerythrin domain-containing protein n=1 Tax=Psychroflexus tropicus TaxID=197345 RepID=UPI00037B683C|nr:hemerythrin domain-containing protein [Psychroflexus tropicus]